jgi:predicted nuclease of predicted toxin-antitoxin system
MMQLLANENFPGDAVTALRLEGNDVAWVREDAPGSTDIQVLERAQNESRIVLTFDKDFGELAYRYGLPASCGIILFRISTPSSRHVARSASAALKQREDWAGHFSVIEDNRIRMSPLPSSKE